MVWKRGKLRRVTPADDPYCDRCGAFLDGLENYAIGGGRCCECDEREACESCDEYLPDTDLEDGLCEACAEEAMRCESCHDLPDDGLDEDGLCAACAEAP